MGAPERAAGFEYFLGRRAGTTAQTVCDTRLLASHTRFRSMMDGRSTPTGLRHRWPAPALAAVLPDRPRTRPRPQDGEKIYNIIVDNLSAIPSGCGS
ncbi:hypothetical protein BCD49_30615 [Pseudofrankia sp. EUN1h]|nr:hypothetical protein BCD49_30615 [Pseudofrankia sp. EUN1h]